MQTVTTKAELHAALQQARQKGQSIGLVPTMGNLHQGHLSLVTAAVSECDFTVATIFVNPLQFGENEDLQSYPRTLAQDQEMLAAAGCKLLFAPAVSEMYGENLASRTVVHVTGLSERYCGESRPGHFDGVATVVTKLFHLVAPKRAYFGLKDFQQFRIIQQLVAELDFSLELRGIPTMREDSGLAMSSRNSYLSEEQRKTAAGLFRTLEHTGQKIIGGSQEFRQLEREAVKKLDAEGIKPDYFAICNARTLTPANTGDPQLVLLAAGYIDTVRLIDNLSIEP